MHLDTVTSAPIDALRKLIAWPSRHGFRVLYIQIGLVIANDIFPEAVDWFSGKAEDLDEDISDEEDSEEDEDDDEADEIDLEKPEPKKQRRT